MSRVSFQVLPASQARLMRYSYTVHNAASPTGKSFEIPSQLFELLTALQRCINSAARKIGAAG